jgi:hypothetical protein
MFDELDGVDLGFEIDSTMTDREILYVLWGNYEIGDMDVVEGWRVLHERYPEDVRLLLAKIYEEVASEGVEAATAARLSSLHASSTEPLRSTIERLQQIVEHELQGDGDQSTNEPLMQAYDHMNRYVSDLLDQAHDATLNGKPLRARPIVPPPALETLEQAQRRGAPVRAYSSQERFEPGEILRHVKFGDGLVRSCRAGKIEVDFGGTLRVLVCKG